MTTQRDALYRHLGDPALAERAAEELIRHPEWTRGVPPNELVEALLRLAQDYDAESSVHYLGRVWEPDPLGRAIMDALRSAKDPDARAHTAWLLKHLASESVWREMAQMALSEEESVQARRWLLEGLDRLTYQGVLGWDDLRETVIALLQGSDPHIRDGALGIVMSLNDTPEKMRILLDALHDADLTVLAVALHALPARYDILTDADLARLRELSHHRNPRVSLAAQDWLEQYEGSANRAGSPPETC